MLDANGKLPASGFLDGSILSRPGSMDSCLEIDATVSRGQYCVLGKTIQNKFTGSLSKKKNTRKKNSGRISTLNYMSQIRSNFFVC